MPAAAAALEPAFEQLWTWEERDRDSCSRSRGTRLASQMEKRGEEINLHGISRPGFNGVAPRERERLADSERKKEILRFLFSVLKKKLFSLSFLALFRIFGGFWNPGIECRNGDIGNHQCLLIWLSLLFLK